MPAYAPAPRGAHRHARRAQGGAAAATSTPWLRACLLRRGLLGVLVLCLLGFSPSAWVAPAVAQVAGGGTLLIDEKFTGPSVPNPDFTVHRSTCLTGASGTPPDGQAQIPDCKFPSGPHGPVPPIGVVPGYLQLTDARGSRAGDILYNRPIPATAGLIATFDQWQYGGSTAGDGMAFFLIDGATQLTQIGGGGGSLGYAQRLVLGERGILGGVLGLGLDAFGNYYNDDEGRGTGCPLALKPPFPLALAPDVVTLRGPGDLEVGYCYLGSTTVPGTDPPQSSLPRSLRAERLELAERRVRITVQPTIGSVAPRIIVEIDFHDGKGLQTVLNLPAPPNLPATYKFGWTGTSTGADDVHLLRNVVVSTVAPLHQLDLVKQLDRTTALPDSLVAGSVVPYQFLVTNGGIETLTALKVQDATLGTVDCPITPLRPAPALGSSVVCTGAHTLTQAEVDAGVVINTATATALNPGNELVTSNPSTVTLVVGAAPRLVLTKFVVERPPYTLGQPVTFRYHLTNEGNVTLTNPRVTDNKVVDVVCSQPPALLQSPLRSAPAFSAATVCTGTHVLQASDLDASGVFTNTAVGFADAPDGSTVSSDSDTVSLSVETTDIAVTKGVDRPAPVLGEVVTYTVTATNQGAVDATGVQVTDMLPEGIPFVDATPSQGTYTRTTGVWTIGDLARGASATLLLQGRVTATGPQTNVARLTAHDQFDSNPDNDQAEATVEDQTPFADLAVTQTVSNATPLVGETVTFTVTATNHGPEAASGLTLSDVVRAGLDLVSHTPSQGTYTPATGAWALGALPVQAQATLTLVVQVVEAGLILNVATRTAGDQLDPNISNNSSGVALTSEPVADLQVHTTADPRVLPLGSEVTFTVTVTNAGPSAASGVAVTDVLPEGLALLSATPAQGTYTPTTGVWALGALAAGTQTTLTLRATVEAVGPLTNRAAKTAQTERDPNPANDASGVTVNGRAADVQVVTTVDRPTPLLGETVTFTVTVTNNGPNTATGVQVRDVLSARLTFVRATVSHGTYTAATGLWEVGTLARAGVAATATLQITATVTQAGRLTDLAAKIDQDQPDPNLNNDYDRLTFPGQLLADLVVTKSHGGSSVVPGTEVTYTVVVTNHGPSAVTEALVSDPIPLLLVDPSQRLPSFEDLTWVCVPSAGAMCPAGGTGAVLVPVTLLVGGTATFTIRGRVAPAARGTLVNTATVFAPAEVDDPLPGNNSATDTDRLTPVADLSITKTDEVPSVMPGTLMRYTLVVRNAGPSAVVGALVQDPASAALAGVAWTCVASAGSSCRAKGTGPLATTVHLAVGGTATFTLTGIVVVAAPGTLANTATVTPPMGVTDPVLDNNTATNTHAVLRPPVSGPPVSGPPSGRKTVQGGESPDLEWRVVWLNTANAVPLRLRGLDPIPGATTYVDGSVTCVARGQSTVVRCAFDAATNQLVYDGTVGPDPGATTEEQAANAVIITFRTAVLPGVTQVVNQALAHWDANGNGTVDDDIQAGQGPARTGTAFGQHDPTLVTLPGLVCLFQQRLLALTVPPSAPTTSSPPPSDGADGGSGGDGAVDAGVDRQSTPESEEVFVLLTPLDSDTVAGSTLTLAAGQVPVAGTTVSQPTEIRIANGAPAATLAIVENVGSKTEQLPAREAHDVVTADGVVVAFPATALAAPDTLRLERGDPTTAPGPLPGVAVRPLVAVTLAGGGTAFSSAVALSLPYADADQDGLVDETSPALPELSLTVWVFDAARGSWMHLPEARVLTAFNALRVATTQTGLYGVFRAADGSTGLAGTTGPASPAPRSAGAQGLGWQDIGEVTTFPFLVPVNTTTLPNGTYEVRAVCTTNPAELRVVAGSAPTTATVLRTSGGDGGGCTLQPGGAWSRATALAALGNFGVPLVALLLLGLWVWRRPR